MTLGVDLYPGRGITLVRAADLARETERSGMSGLWALDSVLEPFLPLAIAAEHTTTISLRTSVAIAFARNPMVVAQMAHELSRFSGGRFQLGLGTQVRAHIERRYSEQWSQPAARMREYVLALRAIWDAWNYGTELQFQGDFYRHTLMTPNFAPAPNPHGSPRILVGGSGPLMVKAAGEVADGLVVHPLTSPTFLAEVQLPKLPDSLPDHFEVSCPVLVISAEDEGLHETATEAVRAKIAFYGSTPAYRPVFVHYDEEDRAVELHRMSREGRWSEMPSLVTDELLAEFCVDAPPSLLRETLQDRFGALLHRAGIYAPYPVPDGHWLEVGP